MSLLNSLPLFDSHFHVIDPRFPLVNNRGFLPDFFTLMDYKHRLRNYDVVGGVVVSGSFQGFDQSYLCAALKTLGKNYVGVTQLPANVSDEEVLYLHSVGIRGVRFNLQRGGSEGLEHLERFARRIYELVGWHIELYVDSRELFNLQNLLTSLPKVSIAHLGLSKTGFPTLLKLVDAGVKVKASGFYRVDFDVDGAIKMIVDCDETALFFGTDLPCTRAKRPYQDKDFLLLVDVLGNDIARKVLHDNPVAFYLS